MPTLSFVSKKTNASWHRRRMSRIFLAVLLSSFVPFHVAEEFFAPTVSDNLSLVHSLLEKWSTNNATNLLTIVLDDYHREPNTFDIPGDIPNTSDVSIKLVTLKHLIRLKYKNMNRDYESFDPGSFILLLFQDINHLREIFNSPHLISFWQPENFYVLYHDNHRFVDWFQLQRFFQWGFEKLWTFRRIFKVILFINGKTIRYNVIDFAGYHTRYFFNSSCDWYCVKNNQDSILVINEPNDTDVSDFFEQRTDFKLYPMKISIFSSSRMTLHDGKYSGIDFNYLEEVTRMMNVTPILMKSVERYGWKENDVFFGTIGHLVYQLADVSFNQFFVKDYSTRQVEFSTVFTNDMLCVLVPKAPPIPDYLIIVKIFGAEAWLLIFLGYFVIFIITMILKDKRNYEILNNLCDFEQRHFCEEFFSETSRISCFLEEQNGAASTNERCNEMQRETSKRRKHRLERVSKNFSSRVLSLSKYLVQMYLQLMQPFNSKRTWFPERLMFICCMLMSAVLNGVFMSQLASSLSKRMYYEDIDTLEELEKSGLPILTTSRDLMDDVFSDVTSPLLKRLRQKLRYANSSEANSKLFMTRDAAVLNTRTTVSLIYNEYENRRRMHIVKECPKHYFVGFLMTKGSPFRERINSILGRLNNAGFYGKWYRGMFQSQRRSYREKEPTEHRKITIRHLFIPFVILQVGLATSTIVFICERRQNNL